MAYDEAKNAGPFELVNNADSKNNVYKIDVVEKEPVLDKTKTNYDWILYDKNHAAIGKKYSDGKLEIFPEYKERLKQVEGISLNSTKLVVKNASVPTVEDKRKEEDRERAEQARVIEQQKQEEERVKNERAQKAELEKKNKENKAEFEPQSSSTRITHQDLLNNPKYKNVNSWTRIDDQTFTDAVNPTTKDGTQIDKNSIIVAEVGGDFKVLAKAMGTDEIIDLSKDAREKNTVKGQSNRIQGNVENDTGRHCTMQIPMFNNKEIVINQTPSGRIDLQQIDYSSGNDDKALPIGTDYMHPTEEELARAKQEQEGVQYNNVIMTREEIEANLAGENEFVYNYVIDKVDGTDENPTNERFNEILDEAHEEEQEKNLNNDDNVKSLDNDALERRERRHRRAPQ